MLSFYPTHPRALRYSPPVYSVYPDDLYSPYHMSPADSRLVTNPELRYRRALGEYLSAAEEYNVIRRAREEAKLRARAEAIRQERARLRVARLARARREQQARQFKQGLAKVLARAAVSGDDDLLHHAPISLNKFQTSERPLSDMFVGSLYVRASCANDTSVEKETPATVQAQKETSVDQSPLSASEPGECDCSVPNLESVLRERLEKIAGDEEVQDLARSILRHLTSATGASPSAAASSPELNTSSTEPDEGAHLSRSHALKGATAEAAKASFKAHRAEVAEKTEPSPTSPTHKTAPSSLTSIEDILSALTELSAGFSFPPSLDFSDDEPDGLAYTPTNAPVRVYEQALNRLLEQLDAVESDGDEEVRAVRRTAVKEVEKTIEDVEKRIREARESARQGGNPGPAVSPEADISESMNVDGALDEDASVDNDESEAKELSSNSGDRVDSAPSRSEILPTPNHEVAGPNAAEATDAKSMQDNEDQYSRRLPVICLPPHFYKSKDDSEVFAEQAITDENTPVPSGPEILITPPDSPAEVSVPTRGAIAPSSTPVTLLVPDELPASLSRDELRGSLGVDDVKMDAADGESE